MEYVPKKNLPENLLPVSEIKTNIYKFKFVLASDSGFVKVLAETQDNNKL